VSVCLSVYGVPFFNTCYFTTEDCLDDTVKCKPGKEKIIFLVWIKKLEVYFWSKQRKKINGERGIS